MKTDAHPVNKDETFIKSVNSKGLLPCPLCGGEITLWNYEFGTVKVFECKACRTRFIFPWDKDVSEWNKRTSCDTCAMYYPDDGCMAGLAEGEVAE